MQFGFRELVFTSLSLGMVAGTYAMIVQPHAKARRERQAEMRSMDEAISAIHNSTEGFDEIAQHVQKQQQDADIFKSRVTKEADISKAIDEVLQTAAANSLQAGDVRLLKRQDVDGLGRQPIKLSFNGNFNGFYAFLLQLEGMPRVKRVTQMDVTGNGDGTGQIQADLTLLMYLE